VLAVTQINGQAFVFVAEPAANGFVSHEREIQVGEIQGNNYVVQSGLKAGERLITSGLAMMSDGMPVVPMGNGASS
jgi:membrane fusion protein (multidrug efflux system)